MQKRLIALVAAGAIYVPTAALADDSTVTLYGKINVGVESIQATGATVAPGNPGDVKSRTRVTDGYSYIGIRGEEPLGDNLKAFFQVENLVKADGPGGNLTVGAANSNTWASRNSGVGLRGSFGEILLGRWDVYYSAHVPGGDATFVRTSFASTALAILGGDSGIGGKVNTLPPGAVNTAQGNCPVSAAIPVACAVDFGGRRNNSVRYASPTIGGVTGIVQYVAPEGTVDTPAGTARDDGIGAELRFQTQVVFADYAYFKRNDLGGVVGNDSTANKLALGVRFAGFTIGAVAERLKHDVDSNAQTRLFVPVAIHRKRDAYVGFLAYAQGPWSVGGTYGQAQKVKSETGDLDQTGAKYYQVTGVFNFSKRTNLYLTVARINNEANAQYDFFNEGGLSDTTTIGRGADPQTVVIGINHFF